MIDSEFIVEDGDQLFEEDVNRNPYHLKSWLQFIFHKEESPPQIRYSLWERALKYLPGSYKLWYNYLSERQNEARHLPYDNNNYADTNNAFERALIFLHKMPRIWTMYCEFLSLQHQTTATRHAFDRSLKALPITQHNLVWPLYLEFARNCEVPESTIRIYRRALKLDETITEEFVDFLLENNRIDEATVQLGKIVDNEKFISQKGQSKHEIWAHLCNLISEHADHITSLNVENVIRGGIRRYTQEVASLWCSLAEHYIRKANFEKARDVYEEAIDSIVTARDFSIVFDAYTQFEESLLQARIQTAEDEDRPTDEDEEEDLHTEIELRCARLDHLISRRPFLLSNVKLRQNPHNAKEWLSRIRLFKEKYSKTEPDKVINVFSEAVTVIDPQKASGFPHKIWLSFARIYLEQEIPDLENARIVYEKATTVNFLEVAHLVDIYCAWVEMELLHKNFDNAREILMHATNVPSHYLAPGEKPSIHDRLHKSSKLWCFLIDLEENFGTITTTKAAYDMSIQLKVATPQMILNYTLYMEEHKLFEDSFSVFERGISMFKYPHVYILWISYLKKFIERYGSQKLERARELFEQSLIDCPAKHSLNLYLLYANLEEKYGLARREIIIYERAISNTASENLYDLFLIYGERAKVLYGIDKAREVYHKAVQKVPKDNLKDMCMLFINLETSLNEIDRARAIYTYCAQYIDPRSDSTFWPLWHKFEVENGNRDTFAEMLRIKRSVLARVSQEFQMPTDLPKRE